MNQRHLLVPIVLAIWGTAPAAELKGLWEFDNPANLGEATVGNPLVVGGTHTHHASLADDGGTSLTGVVTTQGLTTGYFTASHDIPPNGGGAYVNQYTVVTDVLTPSGSRGQWRPIYQTNDLPDGNDSDFWISPDNHLGVAAIGYSTTPIDETRWMRLAITVDLTRSGGDVVSYLDGMLFFTHPADQEIDGRHSLYGLGDLNVIHFYSDNDDGENPPMNVGLIAIYDGVLAPAEIALLGAAGDPVQFAPGRELRWTGAAGGEWSTAVLASPKNWVLAGDGVTEADFMDFDNVRFDDSAAATAVSIAPADVAPGDILFEIETEDYLLDGGNGILDPATLTKRGAATLTIDNANSFHGATHLEGGSLVLGNELALQNSPLTIGPGTSLDFGTLAAVTIGGLSGEVDLPLENSAGVPQAVALRVNGGGNYGGALSASGSLTKGGAGILSLASPSTFAGGATIEGGRLQIGDPGALGGGPVMLAGGALGFSFGNGSSEVFSNDLALGPVGQPTFVIKGDDGTNISVPTTVELAGVISGGAPGEVFRFNDTDQTGNHLNVLVLSNPANSFQGVVQMWRGTLAITSDEALGDPANDIQHYTENLNGALRFDADGITLNASREIDFPGDRNARPIDTQSFDARIEGPLTGVANLVKQGSGTLTLSGPTTFSGAVEVAEGALVIEGAADLSGAGDVVVASSGVLDVSALAPDYTLFGNLSGEGQVVGELLAFSTVSPGAAVGAIGTLTTGTITLDFFFNAELDSSVPSADRLRVLGDLRITSNAELVLIDVAAVPGTLPPGTKLALIEYTGAWDGGTFTYIEGFDFVTLEDGDTLTLGDHMFVIDYDDTSDGMNAGKFVTLTVPSAGGAFEAWAAGQGLDGSPGRESGFADNPDDDQLANGLEWILGGNPLVQDSSAHLPAVQGDEANGLTITFSRGEDSIGAATLLVQWNTDLRESWNDVVVGMGSSGPDANGVTVTVEANAEPDEITVHIPAANAVDGKIFARLFATQP